MKVRITAEAERDLDGIAEFIARDNSQRALSFILELRDECLDLAAAPLSFAPVSRYENLSSERFFRWESCSRHSDSYQMLASDN